jgi:hypothetical protein
MNSAAYNFVIFFTKSISIVKVISGTQFEETRDVLADDETNRSQHDHQSARRRITV